MSETQNQIWEFVDSIQASGGISEQMSKQVNLLGGLLGQAAKIYDYFAKMLVIRIIQLNKKKLLNTLNHLI